MLRAKREHRSFCTVSTNKHLEYKSKCCSIEKSAKPFFLPIPFFCVFTLDRIERKKKHSHLLLVPLSRFGCALTLKCTIFFFDSIFRSCVPISIYRFGIMFVPIMLKKKRNKWNENSRKKVHWNEPQCNVVDIIWMLMLNQIVLRLFFLSRSFDWLLSPALSCNKDRIYTIARIGCSRHWYFGFVSAELSLTLVCRIIICSNISSDQEWLNRTNARIFCIYL